MNKEVLKLSVTEGKWPRMSLCSHQKALNAFSPLRGLCWAGSQGKRWFTPGINAPHSPGVGALPGACLWGFGVCR